MTEPEEAGTRGRPLVALLAVGWVGLGFWSVEGGETWLGAAQVGVGALMGATYLWPGSAFSRFVDAPTSRRKRPADR